MAWLDPFAAAFDRTVNLVLCREFLVLSVPFDFEFRVEKPFDVFQGDMIRCTASGGHMLRIFDGKSKDALQTGMAHPV